MSPSGSSQHGFPSLAHKLRDSLLRFRSAGGAFCSPPCLSHIGALLGRHRCHRRNFHTLGVGPLFCAHFSHLTLQSRKLRLQPLDDRGQGHYSPFHSICDKLKKRRQETRKYGEPDKSHQICGQFGLTRGEAFDSLQSKTARQNNNNTIDYG